MSSSPLSLSDGFKVHPVAELFPMMSEEELDELAADIKANGQHQYIVLKDNVIIDGRNRLEACKRAGVEPKFEKLQYNFDPVLFILSQNINRRHLSKGQRAILTAKCMKEVPSKSSQREQAKNASLDQSDIYRANMILLYAPDLAEAILAENGKFDPAYQTAKQRKETAERNQTNSTRLAEEDPQLWAKVQDDNDPLTLDAAIIELGRRQRAAEEKKLEEAAARAQQRQLSTEHLETALNYCEPHGYTPQEWAQRFLELFDPTSLHQEITRKRIEQSAAVLNYLSQIWPYGQM